MSQVWNKELVETYIEMTREYDGPLLIDWIFHYVDTDATVLELGMGPGKDLLELQKNYRATGSDSSPEFIERFRKKHPGSDLLALDAVTMDTDRLFDCICSNKVLQHLTMDELNESLANQAKALAPKGILLHTFWAGEGMEENEGILFVMHSLGKLKLIFEEHYEVLFIETYKEDADNDSIVVVAQKRGE